MTPQMIDRGDGVRLACRHTPGHGPAIVFLPGYMSDMGGTKALHLEGWARDAGRAFLRLDYSGCGASEGDFAHGSISRWADDARAVIETAADGPVVLVGSSMGGWIMLRLAPRLGSRVAGMVGIAAAPDFTRWGLKDAERARALTEGYVERPSAYGDQPYRYHRALVADDAFVLEAPLALACPVRLLHGQQDPDVPWELSLRLAAHIGSDDVQVMLVKDGDHRLSRREDLRLLTRTLDDLLA